MQMTEIFDKLKILQDILSERFSIECKIKEVPEQLKGQEELLSRLKKEYIEKNQEYEKVKDEVMKSKSDLAAAIKSREEGEKGMDNINTHREYEALDKQITEATAREANIRKDLQKQEKNFAELDEILKANEAMIKDQEIALTERQSSLQKELDDYNKQLNNLEKKEGEVAPGLDEEIVYKFQRIIQRNNQGIVAVKKGVCDGCHMILPAQFANEVRDGNEILFCPYCSRILYYQETEEDDDEDYSVMPGIGSLAEFADDEDDSEKSEDYDEDNENDSDDYEKSSEYEGDDDIDVEEDSTEEGED